MAITDTSKVDFLWKKIIFGATKTDTGAAKLGNNESIPSPLPVYSDQIWSQSTSDDIPTTPPLASTPVVQVLTGLAAVQTEPDNTAGAFGRRPTWLTNLSDWIPPTFGSQYAVKVYAGTPETGKQLFPGTSNIEWVFDYNAGVLHFPNDLPGEIVSATSNFISSIYIEGYRYIGEKGTPPASEGSLVTRNTWEYITPEIPVDGSFEFEIELGISLIIYDLTVSAPCLVQVYGTPERDEDNPYTFRGVEGHLRDDGTTELEDGTIIKTRQYSIFANLEEEPLPKVYAKITNETDTPQQFTISLTYFAAVVDVSGRPPKDLEVVNTVPGQGIDGKLIYSRDKESIYIWVDGEWKKVATVTKANFLSGLFHGETTNDIPTTLSLDASPIDTLMIPLDSSLSLNCNISAHCASTGESYTESVIISLRRVSTGINLVKHSLYTNMLPSGLPWLVTFTEDNVNGGFKILVKGQTGKTIKWAVSFTGSCTS